MTIEAFAPSQRKPDVFELYGRNLARSIHEHLYPDIPIDNYRELLEGLHEDSHSRSGTRSQPRDYGVTPVGILGGGMAGLYTALILAYLRIPFQILEATDRVGGRCFTYKFKQGGPYDYYDVGAMRFPLPKQDQDGKDEPGPHERLKKLFELLDIPQFEYIFKHPWGIKYFNGEHARIDDEKARFHAEALGVPNGYIDVGPQAICDDFLEPLAALLLKDLETGGSEGWQELKDKYDQYSTRSYLQFEYVPSQKLRDDYGLPDTSLSPAVIGWLETFDKSSGWYDRALVETVLEAIAFGNAPNSPKPEWRCIKGGTSVLPETTLEKVREWAKEIKTIPAELIVMNAPVTKITPSDPNDKQSPLIVTAGGKEYKFAHVISSLPLPNFGLIDTDGLEIGVKQRNALRQLQYGPSIKVGILFKSAWWKELEPKQIGGQSFTDLPVRTIVYPSYGEEKESKVLIASYCWTNDAERLGNIIDSGADESLKDVVLRNLATVHRVPVEKLYAEFDDMKAFNWNHNAWSGGAFAFFGPSQYQYLYDSLNAPAANGRLQWAGELLSVRHAWIVGALDSAWAAVNRYLILTKATPEVFQRFYTKFGVNLEWRDPSEGARGGSADPTSPGEQLSIPNSQNLLLRHMLLHDPDLSALPRRSA